MRFPRYPVELCLVFGFETSPILILYDQMLHLSLSSMNKLNQTDSSIFNSVWEVL